MTTMHDKIAALPPMPQPLLNPNYPGETVRQFREQYWVDVARAALARLALAREICPMLDQLRVSAFNADWHTFDATIDEAHALLAALEAKP